MSYIGHIMSHDSCDSYFIKPVMAKTLEMMSRFETMFRNEIKKNYRFRTLFWRNTFNYDVTIGMSMFEFLTLFLTIFRPHRAPRTKTFFHQDNPQTILLTRVTWIAKVWQWISSSNNIVGLKYCLIKRRSQMNAC